MLKMDKLWQMVNIYENLKGKNGFFTTRSPFVSKMFALDANELASFNSLILKTLGLRNACFTPRRKKSVFKRISQLLPEDKR